MTTISDKFNRAFQSKEAIRQALISKGVDVSNDVPFADYAEKINDISVGDPYYEEFYNIRTNNGTNLSGLFAHYKGKSVNNKKIDTSKATDMSYMFSNCYSASVLMLGNFDTSNVIDMRFMFEYCWTLQYLDISNFDASKVENINGMFYECGNLSMVLMDNCSRDTISKIINELPTYDIPNVRKRVSVRGKNVVGLTPPDTWQFYYVDTPYEEVAQTLAINEEVEQEVIEEQEQMLINEEETYYDSDNENLMI